jgi:hypothetical protein
MRIDRVTGDGWWRIFRFRGLTRPRARNSDNGKHLSQPVTRHPRNSDATTAHGPRGVKNFSRSTL